MNSGVPPTAWNARTGEFTPPGIRRCARANSSSDWVMAAFLPGFGRLGRRRSGPANEILRVVGQDHVGAGAADGGERLLDDALLVHPAAGGRGLDHRVFAGDVVGGERSVAAPAHRA